MNNDAFGLTAITLQTWRERGSDRLDPVRFRYIEALARRTSKQHGEARRRLDATLAGLLEAYGATAVKAQAPQPKNAAPSHSALAQVVEDITRQRADTTAQEVQGLRYFRSTWSRLNANRRLTQSLAKEPENAGPLNSHHLVLRSLTLMRDVSPDYLNHFMSYVDALAAVEQMSTGAPAGGPAPRAAGGKKAARGKANG